YTAEMRANLLLEAMDTPRADAFEPYGAPCGSTPAATQLAQRGAASPSVIAPASWRLPSPAPMLTGTLPREPALRQPPELADDGAAEAEQVIRRWLREDQRPFFWFVNLIECHSPYLPPRPYCDLSPLQRVLAADEARRFLTVEAIWAACLGARRLPERALARM